MPHAATERGGRRTRAHAISRHDRPCQVRWCVGGCTMQVLEGEDHIGEEGDGLCLCHGAVLLEHVLAVLVQPLHDEVERVLVPATHHTAQRGAAT
jgi:hypothetical protein